MWKIKCAYHVYQRGIFQNFFQLDDKEFDIPPVKNPPTLESILNEVSKSD